MDILLAKLHDLTTRSSRRIRGTSRITENMEYRQEEARRLDMYGLQEKGSIEAKTSIQR